MAATTPVTGGRLPAAFDVIASELTTRASTETLDAAMVRDFVGRMVLQAMALADEGRAAAVTEATTKINTVATEATTKINKLAADIEEVRNAAGKVSPEMVANMDMRMAVLDAGLKELTEVELPKVVSMVKDGRGHGRDRNELTVDKKFVGQPGKLKGGGPDQDEEYLKWARTMTNYLEAIHRGKGGST